MGKVAVNFAVGYADSYTGGASTWMLQATVGDGWFDRCSKAFKAGGYAQMVTPVASPGKAIAIAKFATAGGGAHLAMAAVAGGKGLPRIEISKSRWPEAAGHIEDAVRSGVSPVITVDRVGAPGRRKASLKGVPTRKGYDRDEFPPAVAAEGGAGSSVRHIDPSDNRGAGSSMGHQLSQYPDGTQVEIHVVG